VNTLRLHYKQGQFNAENLDEKPTNVVRTSETHKYAVWGKLRIYQNVKFDAL
jgi:hypothetical protein